MPNIPISRILVYGVFGAWLAASALAQDPTRKFLLTRKLDPHGSFLPDWRFFAPRPAMHDYHLLMRDELSDGTLTQWRDVYQINERKWHHAVWFPGRRAEKVVADAVSGLVTFSKLERRPEEIQLTLAYLTLLNYITHQVEHAPDTVRSQFLIAISAGYEESEDPGMLFLSNLHPLRPRVTDKPETPTGEPSPTGAS